MIEIIILYILRNMKLCNLAYKVACIDDKSSKPVILYRGINAVNKLIDRIPTENEYCKIMIKQHFNEKLVRSAEDEKSFKSNNKCQIYNKLFVAEDNKVRNLDLVIRRYRRSGHLSCIINLKLTKTFSVIFHNLKGYASHLIMREICKFDVKISVIPNGLEN